MANAKSKNWPALNAAFQKENAKTGITVKEWCENNGLKVATAKRHIRISSANKENKVARKPKRRKPKAQSGQGVEANCDTGEKLQTVSQLDSEDFAVGSGTHGFYAEYMNDDDIDVLSKSHKVKLDAELGLMRVRVVRATKALGMISTDIENADSVEQRTQLYDQYLRMEGKLDWAVQRIESITRALADIQEKSVLLRLKAKKLDSSSDKDIEQIKLIKKQIEEKGVIIDLRKNTAGGEKVTYEIDW